MRLLVGKPDILPLPSAHWDRHGKEAAAAARKLVLTEAGVLGVVALRLELMRAEMIAAAWGSVAEAAA